MKAQTTESPSQKTVTLILLALNDDPRYSTQQRDARYPLHSNGNLFDAMEVAQKETVFPLKATQINLQVQIINADTLDELQEAVDKALTENTHFFVLDLPADMQVELAKRNQNKAAIFFNVSVLDSRLRQADCQANLLHIVPSWNMLMDGLAQYLISKKWKEIFVLAGKLPEDQALLQDFNRTAKRYGLKIVETRGFINTNDPRERQQNNVALLTANVNYDVLFVADTAGEFASTLPYQTQLPRPVVGTSGMVIDWWHWAWTRHGAPQVNKRFYKQANRDMTGYDWAAWQSVKIIAEAIQRIKTDDFQQLSNFIRGNMIVIDGTKGAPQSFRRWDNQMRQPLFVTNEHTVITRLPLEGFLHPINQLDTLGIDEKESQCKQQVAPAQ